MKTPRPALSKTQSNTKKGSTAAPPSPLIPTIPRFYLNFYVDDVHRTSDFYANAFDISLESAFREDADEFLKLQRAQGLMTYYWIKSGRPPLDVAGQEQQDRIGFRLTIEVNEIRFAVRQAFCAGADVVDEYQTRSKYVAVVRDPDGLMIELYAWKSSNMFDAGYPEDYPLTDLSGEIRLDRLGLLTSTTKGGSDDQ